MYASSLIRRDLVNLKAHRNPSHFTLDPLENYIRALLEERLILLSGYHDISKEIEF